MDPGLGSGGRMGSSVRGPQYCPKAADEGVVPSLKPRGVLSESRGDGITSSQEGL